MTDESLQNLSDEELVVKTLEQQAFFALVITRYQEKLLRYIRRITDISSEDAEDLLQDIFIRVYQNLRGFDQSLSFSSWIYRVAHNTIIDSFRRRKSRPHGNTVILEDNELEQIAADFDLTNTIDHALLKEQIAQTLTKIDLKYREVLVLRYMQEKSYEEIADIIKKPPGTVATLLNRAKKQFLKHYTYGR